MNVINSVSFVSAVNDEAVARTCLLASPDLDEGIEVALQRDFCSAASAYNQALEKVTGEVIVFVHQDVFFPKGWYKRFIAILARINQLDSNWGVLGLYGLDASGQSSGWVYSTGLGDVVGCSFSGLKEVRTLDEVLLVVRRSSGLRFDDSLTGFHMYGTDLCLEAEKMGLRNYAISCPAIHNSNGIKQLPRKFWQARRFIRNKWWNFLPIHAPCAKITRMPYCAVKSKISRFVRFSLRRQKVGTRVADPAQLYEQLLADGKMPDFGKFDLFVKSVGTECPRTTNHA